MHPSLKIKNFLCFANLIIENSFLGFNDKHFLSFDSFSTLPWSTFGQVVALPLCILYFEETVNINIIVYTSGFATTQCSGLARAARYSIGHLLHCVVAV